MPQQAITVVGSYGADSRRVLDTLTPRNASGAPTTNATYIGQIYVDEAASPKAVYISIAVGSATPANDWQKISAAV
jgi:hypothetical protein